MRPRCVFRVVRSSDLRVVRLNAFGWDEACCAECSYWSLGACVWDCHATRRSRLSMDLEVGRCRRFGPPLQLVWLLVVLTLV